MALGLWRVEEEGRMMANIYITEDLGRLVIIIIIIKMR